MLGTLFFKLLTILAATVMIAITFVLVFFIAFLVITFVRIMIGSVDEKGK